MTRTATHATPARLALYAQARIDLLAQRQALLSGLLEREGEGSRVQHAQEVLSQDSDDAQAHDADREVDLALSDQDRLHLADISAALARLEAGRYGDCADCGEPIAAQRLQVQPQALRCVACAGKREGALGSPARASL
jgi:DnaK suppressor protein